VEPVGHTILASRKLQHQGVAESVDKMVPHQQPFRLQGHCQAPLRCRRLEMRKLRSALPQEMHVKRLQKSEDAPLLLREAEPINGQRS